MKTTIVIMVSLLTLATGAWALEPSGNYTYKEKGYTGEMNVSRISPIEASWNIRIVTVESANAHTCEVEGVINNTVSDAKSVDAVFVSTEDIPGKFSVTFTKGGAEVEVTDIGGFCGMNGYFGGKWVKDGSKRKSKKR